MSEQRSMTRGVARDVGNIACDILEQFILADRTSQTMARGTFIDGQHDHLWDCDFHLVHEIAERTVGGSRYYLADLENDAKDYARMFWPLDHASIVDKEDHWFMCRVVSVSAADVRGFVKITPPQIVVLAAGWLPKRAANDPYPRWETQAHICGLVGGQWRSIENDAIHTRTTWSTGDTIRTLREPSPQGELHRSIMLSFAARLTERYAWHAALGFAEKGPRVVLPTNPEGCLDLFKSRMLAPGEKRRAALRHWVNTHYRDTPGAASDLTFVREHLRGNARFLWNDLDCELMVSEIDLEKNEFFAAQAAEWRSMRKHNRVRLRVKR